MEGFLIILFPFYISDLAIKIKGGSGSSAAAAHCAAQPGQTFLPGNTGACPVHLKFRLGAGGASGFSFQTIFSLKPFPDILIFL